MANSQAVCTSFKGEALRGMHALGTTVTRGSTAADTLMGALYLASASLGAATTAYTTTGEVTGTNYTPGGVTVTNANTPATSGTTAYWTPSAGLVYTNVTLASAFDAVLIYNSSQSNRAIMVCTFPSQTVAAGTLTLTMPSNDSTNGLLRLA